jgi:hypothetical protein
MKNRLYAAICVSSHRNTPKKSKIFIFELYTRKSNLSYFWQKYFFKSFYRGGFGIALLRIVAWLLRLYSKRALGMIRAQKNTAQRGREKYFEKGLDIWELP